MSIGPLGTCAGLSRRQSNLVEAGLLNAANVLGFKFWGHRTLNGAYGNPAGSGVGGSGPAAMFSVAAGGFFLSDTFKRNRYKPVDAVRRGVTSVIFDPEEFTVPGGVFPKDMETLFLRVQEERIGVGLLNYGGDAARPVLGPILVVPPAAFYSSRGPAVTLYGLAPVGTTSTAGLPAVLSDNGATPSALYLVVPVAMASINVQNLGAADLLVSFGVGNPMTVIPANSTLSLSADMGSISEVLLAATGGAALAFSISGFALCER